MRVTVTIKDACGYPTDATIDYNVSLATAPLWMEKLDMPEEEKASWLKRFFKKD